MTKTDVSLRDIYQETSKNRNLFLNAIHELRDEIRETYVTKGEFLPVKMIAYSIVGMASSAVLFALLTRVVIAIIP